MYVRLAFAVAANLEPEILIVDEVLAVGDAQFQSKCLGKMQEVSAGGRTVLFVSHNIAAITALTTRCIVLGSGRIIADTTTDEAINIYASTARPTTNMLYLAEPGLLPTITRVCTSASNANGDHVCGNPFTIDVDIHFQRAIKQPCLSVQIVNEQSVPVTHFWSYDTLPQEPFKSGTTRFQFSIPRLALNVGHYTLTLHLAEPPGGEIFECVTNACPFIVDIRGRTTLFGWRQNTCTYLENFDCRIAEVMAFQD
jgi:lipopolysaccharide transport system ATP-binding protein